MGEARKPRPAAQDPDAVPGPSQSASELRARVIEQSPGLFITLVSVLIGLVLSDLVTEARARMHLWPLDLLALRSWGQLMGNSVSGLAVWMVLAHLGVARRRAPHMVESFSAFGPPLMLLASAGLVGRPEVWPWFYGASAYLAVSIVSDTIQVRLTMDQPGGQRFARLAHPLGHLVVCYLGAPAYLAAAVLDQNGLLPGWIATMLVFAPLPSALLLVWMFFRDWRAALDDV